MNRPAEKRRVGGSKPRWSDEQLEAELRELITELGHWPSQAELRACGRLDLLGAMRRRGGVARWAKRLGQPIPKAGGKRPRKWTDERIEAELRALVKRLGHWPSQQEIEEAGHKGLVQAVARSGGSRSWAERLGLRPRGGGPRPGRR